MGNCCQHREEKAGARDDRMPRRRTGKPRWLARSAAVVVAVPLVVAAGAAGAVVALVASVLAAMAAMGVAVAVVAVKRREHWRVYHHHHHHHHTAIRGWMRQRQGSSL